MANTAYETLGADSRRFAEPSLCDRADSLAPVVVGTTAIPDTTAHRQADVTTVVRLRVAHPATSKCTTHIVSSPQTCSVTAPPGCRLMARTGVDANSGAGVVVSDGSDRRFASTLQRQLVDAGYECHPPRDGAKHGNQCGLLPSLTLPAGPRQERGRMTEWSWV